METFESKESKFNWICCKCNFKSIKLFQIICIIDIILCILVFLLNLNSLFYSPNGFDYFVFAIGFFLLGFAGVCVWQLLTVRKNLSDGSFPKKGKLFTMIQWGLTAFAVILAILMTVSVNLRHNRKLDESSKSKANINARKAVLIVFTILVLFLGTYVAVVLALSLSQVVKDLSITSGEGQAYQKPSDSPPAPEAKPEVLISESPRQVELQQA